MNLLFLVLTFAGWMGQTVTAPTGTIEGYVIREGSNPPEPLANARLELLSIAAPIVTRTDSSGRFAFSNLPDGPYRLAITRDGYLRQELRGPLRISGPPIVFRMIAAPTISGIVRDPMGTPIANILVKALKRSYDARGNRILTPVVSTRTDDRGNYRLYWLDVGEYFLSAEREGVMQSTTVQGIDAKAFAAEGALRAANVKTTYAPTYFPGFADPLDAKPINLDSGRDAGGMDFILSESTLATVAVTVTSFTTGGRGGPSAEVKLTRPEGVASTAKYAGTALRGTLALNGIAPGTYLITATSASESAAQRIRVTNADLYVRLNLQAPVTLNGTVINSEGLPMDLRKTRLRILEADPLLPAPPPVTIGANNRFAISGVQPGMYSVTVSGLPEDLYVKTAAYASADALAKPFDVGGLGVATSELNVVVGLDGGRIGGAAVDQSNQRFPGAQVILVPEVDVRFRLDRYRYAETDDDGTFLIRGIPPGQYKLFAWDGIEANAELNTEYMRSYEEFGTPVRIAPGENSAVDLRVIQAGR